MKEVACIDHLRAAPVSVIIKTKSGRTCERGELGWTEMGQPRDHEVTFDDETDFPATVIWSYAQEIGDPATEALAQLALVWIKQQQQADAAAAAEQNRQNEMARQITEQFSQQNGQPPVPQSPLQVVEAPPA
jgi:hypothetical protein